MKSTLFTLLLISINITTFGQARLGYKASEIRTEFIDPSYNQKSGYTTDNEYYICISAPRAIVYYYFDSDFKCDLTVIVPDNQGAINYFVELYNKNYVIVSDTYWKMYSETGICHIRLKYIENGGCFFAWTLQ